MPIPPAQEQYNQANENQARFLISVACDAIEARLAALEAVSEASTPPPVPVGNEPTASFTYYKVGRSVTFTDQSTAVAPETIVAWRWDFGDSGTATVRNPVHIYATNGTFTVSLSVTDSRGRVSLVNASKSVTVTNLGVPFGPHGPLTPTINGTDTAVFTMSQNAENAGTILGRISAARTAGKKLILMLTGGAHSKYTTAGLGNYGTTNAGFDIEKWKHGPTAGAPADTGMDQYNTATIKTAVNKAIEEGVVLGCDIVDEPQAADWGANITKAMLDTMTTYVKGIFPNMPVGCSVLSNYRKTLDDPYTKLDFITVQYIQNFGPPAGAVSTWRDARLADAAADGVKVLFSINGPNGGAGFKEFEADGVTTKCPTARTLSPVSPCGLSGALYGGNEGRCAMSKDQLETFGGAMIGYGLGLLIWKHNDTYMALTGSKSAFATLASSCAAATPRSWKRA